MSDPISQAEEEGGKPDVAPPRGVVALSLLDAWANAGVEGLLYITANEQTAEQLGANIYSLAPDCPVMVLPRWDALPYDLTPPSREIAGRRASVLRRLADGLPRPLLIATPEAVLQRLPPRGAWRDATLEIVPNSGIPAEEITRFLERTGYQFCAAVDAPGEASVQGRTLDVFPAGALAPVRLELTEGRVTAVRTYDPATQRTTDYSSELVLDAASEFTAAEPDRSGSVKAGHWLCDHYPKLETIWDYLPNAAIVIGQGVGERVTLWMDRVREGYESWNRLLRAGAAGTDTGPAPEPAKLYCDMPEWQSRLRDAGAQALACIRYDRGPLFATEPNPRRSFQDFIRTQVAEGVRLVLAAAEPGDLRAMSRRAEPALREPATQVSDWRSVPEAITGQACSIEVDLDCGFVLPQQRIVVIAAPDLLGSRAHHQRPMDVSVEHHFGDEASFRIDEPVVHIEHGIGLLRGIETIAAADPELGEDTLRLEYAGGTMLMLPVQEINFLWSYGAASAPLDRLGGESWSKRRAEILREIDATAKQLLALAEAREAQIAPKLAAPLREYERFAAGFPYPLTADQERAIGEVLGDLGSGYPMDRLLCGEVGFGKTEVALRAAAAAALAGKQVAVVVPTTVLARQHFGTFQRRFAPFGIEVQLLTRFVKPADARLVKEGLRDGTVRVVIGTHAIASRGVRFNDLGLLITDEEQRFGSALKQKLRDFGKGLHVLAMSATPIPRTLQRALAGLQTLSTLESPPARRLPPRTVLTRFGPALIRDVLLYEKNRGGQSFLVCPRIEDLEPMAEQLRRTVPALRVVMVHGKLPPAEVDEAVVSFAEGGGDVLLTTNIIETGLDIPRANTILIWRPDRFGTAQLHQLRGRVGRGRRRGLAYLLTDPETELPGATQGRLQALTELSQLGAGFAVSRRDLDFRGAGDLLGPEQTGHVRQIGLDLYRHLLHRALSQARSGKAENVEIVPLRLGIPAAIPADYVSDPEARINLYARLARLATPAHIDDFADELEDRFGTVPIATKNLLHSAQVGMSAVGIGIVQIDAGPVGVAFTFRADLPNAVRDCAKTISGARSEDSRVVFQRPSNESDRVKIVAELLDQLSPDQDQTKPRPSGN